MVRREFPGRSTRRRRNEKVGIDDVDLCLGRKWEDLSAGGSVPAGIARTGVRGRSGGSDDCSGNNLHPSGGGGDSFAGVGLVGAGGL